MWRNGRDVFAGVLDDFEHLRRVCGGEVELERLGAVPAFSLVGVEGIAVVFGRGFAGTNRRQVADGIKDGDGALMALARE